MTDNASTTALDTVLGFHRAWTGGDVDGAMNLVAEDVLCRAPGQDLTGRESYRTFLAGFVPNLTGVTDIAQFADGDRVVLVYYPHTAATDSALATECFTVRDGTIVENLLVFDRLSFTPPGAA